MDSKMMKNLAVIVGILVVLHLLFSTNETDISSQERESVCIRTTEELPDFTDSEEEPMMEEMPVVEEEPMMEEMPVSDEELMMEEMPVVSEGPVVEEEKVLNISGWSGNDSISADFLVEGMANVGYNCNPFYKATGLYEGCKKTNLYSTKTIDTPSSLTPAELQKLRSLIN